MVKITIIGLGFVGEALLRAFVNINANSEYNFYGYDKFKTNFHDDILDNILTNPNDYLDSDIIITALPTKYSEVLNSYDNSATFEVCKYLQDNNYSGVIVVKSTVTPGTTHKLCTTYPNLHFVYNPEFLTAKTAYDDIVKQDHIVLGKSKNCTNDDMAMVYKLYTEYWPQSVISTGTSVETEMMKIACNTFYSVKIQYFNELYCVVKYLDENIESADFNNVREMMLKNNWINPMHTQVPGTDGKMSYGGLCFPKDTNALLSMMKDLDLPHKVLSATVEERNFMRDDHDNVVRRHEKTKCLVS